MGLAPDWILETALKTNALLIILASCLIVYMRRCLTYWKRRNITSLEATIPFGNMESPLTPRTSQGMQYKAFYQKFRKLGVPYGGIYSLLTPVFIPVEAEYLKLVLIKDFQFFQARGFYSNEKDQPISAHIFALDGERWRNLRTKLSPTFTSGKMKTMFQTLANSAVPMAARVRQDALDKKPINIQEIAALYTTDVIGSCIFGLDCNSFKDPDTKFFRLLRIAMNEATSLVKGLFCYSFQNLAKKLKLVPFSKHSAKYFTDIITDTVAFREKNKIRRNDFLQLLINMKNKEGDYEITDEVGDLTIDEIASQSFLFFLAGFDTSSLTMAYCLFELAQQQDIQQKARDEVNTVLAKYNGQVTYDSLTEMKYLQQVLDETLRKYPALPLLHRKATEDYVLPNSDIVIEKGTPLVVPILGVHYDPEYYPDPEKFDPERFSEENKSQVIPGTYLPFGDGPRHCIGLRFGVMQTKTGLVALLKNFVFTLNTKTKVPLEYSTILMLQSKHEILLNVKNVN